MGIIQRQSIKKSIVNYVGVGIGVISTLFIYPRSLDEYGLLQFLASAAILLAPIANLGSAMTVVRFFPDFKNDKNGHNGYLGLLVLSILVGFLVMVGLLFLLRNPIYLFYESREDSDLIPYLLYVLPLTYLMANVNMLINHISNFKRVVVPTIINDLFLKVAQPSLIILFLLGIVTTDEMVWLYLLVYLSIMLGLFAYLHYLNELKFRINFAFLTKPFLKKIGAYIGFAILGSVSSLIAFRLDIVMVASYLGRELAGTYGIALFIVNSIEIPQRSMISIAAPIISSAIKEKNYEEIEQLYKKVSINLGVFGLLLFLVVFFNFEDLFTLIPKGEKLLLAKYVVLFLGLAKLTDMFTSVNGQIIGFSKYYRFNMYSVAFLSILNVILNLILIPIFKINGAAIATAISIIFYNLLKLAYVYLKFGIHPFSRNTVQVLVLSIITAIGLLFFPSTGILILNILLRAVFVGFLFAIGIFYFNIAPDIKDLVKKTLAKIQFRN